MLIINTPADPITNKLTSTCTCGITTERGLEFTKHRAICPNAIEERRMAQEIADEDDERDEG